jgi:hypothetical protein
MLTRALSFLADVSVNPEKHGVVSAEAMMLMTGLCKLELEGKYEVDPDEAFENLRNSKELREGIKKEVSNEKN